MGYAPDLEPLTGFTVAVTADRRRDELATLLRQRGARVVLAPALRIVPGVDGPELRRATLACTSAPLDAVVVTTGTGLRDWLAAAEDWGLADPLRSRLATTRLVVRGPAARTAVRAAGLPDAWSPASDSDDDVLDQLLSDGVAGKRIALQLDGEPQSEFSAALRAAGAYVIEVPVYRWAPPLDPAPLHRLVDLTVNRLVDAVTFTSAPAVGSLLRAAGPAADAALHALRTEVVAACLGPLTAAPLRDRQVPVLQPPRARLSDLVRTLTDELPRRSRTLCVAGTSITLRGHAAVVNGVLRPLAPAPMAVLRTLAERPGRVLSRTALLRALPRGADEHAVEMAVARLRAGIGGSGYVQTVVKRGYRLRVD
ncbi:uroporphyrinogen-III synthase [Planosporangium mesophilum]|uniref:Uroporphyrinogen III methyltransferase n=1 Tax=Planosporangium mesophilum TaxID=689768 RepID=A0A8J3TD39_9ACTN|nr:uroporphyrinogen-III synthase [Planosporangium mesophilum]NJC84759.1 uroporphyrinogen-III synthase [Planosporangium mesophilum]GII24223.1 uroporphyrinogen III methyltransferase [Planosporangium mesophilum]